MAKWNGLEIVEQIEATHETEERVETRMLTLDAEVSRPR